MAVGREPACISLPFCPAFSAPPFPGVGMHVHNRFPVVSQKEPTCSDIRLNIRINLTFSIHPVRSVKIIFNLLSPPCQDGVMSKLQSVSKRLWVALRSTHPTVLFMVSGCPMWT